MPRMKAHYPYHLGVDSGVFKDDEFKTEAKTNSRPIGSPLFACEEHARNLPESCNHVGNYWVMPGVN